MEASQPEEAGGKPNQLEGCEGGGRGGSAPTAALPADDPGLGLGADVQSRSGVCIVQVERRGSGISARWIQTDRAVHGCQTLYLLQTKAACCREPLNSEKVLPTCFHSRVH